MVNSHKGNVQRKRKDASNSSLLVLNLAVRGFRLRMERKTPTEANEREKAVTKMGREMEMMIILVTKELILLPITWGWVVCLPDLPARSIRRIRQSTRTGGYAVGQTGRAFTVSSENCLSWIKIACLKANLVGREHIYRNHAIPVHCPRFMTMFDSSPGLSDHLRQLGPTPCPLNSPRVLDGFTEDQEAQLKYRATHGLCEEEKWKKVFRILFPDVPEGLIPSPCKSIWLHLRS